MSAPGARRVLVTGAASGIGLETALALARSGDHVVVADRDVARGEAAVRRIVEAGGRAELRELELADLSRIRDFAADELARGVVAGGYYGPTGFGQMHGPPGPVEPSPRALDTDVAARLWKASERLTGVRYGMS